MDEREIKKDKKEFHSVFSLPLRAPYPLNVYERDFLIQALTAYKAR